MSSNTKTAVAFLALLASPAAAFWRLPCSNPIVVQRADPIVNPGKPSGHLHTIMGGNGFGFNMTYEDTQASTCSSCKVTKDFSNYWVPSLYYQGKNGSFTSVNQVGGSLVYYLQRSDPDDPEPGLLAFPEGFRMLAGNPFLRSYTDTVEQQAISFSCLGVNGPETNNFPNMNCPDGLRAQVFFPSCWNGKDLDTPDHKSHMSYPSVYNAGKCPPEFPKRFISLFYEVVWDTNAFKDDWYGSKQPFVLAQGDDTGYGYHGDFVNGWDVPTLQKAVTECTNLSGVVEDCPVFEFFEDSFTNGCKIPASIDEQVSGVLEALPGCNPVQSGPGIAVAQSGCGAPTTIGAPETNFVDMTVSKKFEYVGCGSDNISSRTLRGASTSAPDMTNEKCVDFCTSKGFSIAGTEYSDECYCDNAIPKANAPITGLMGNCFMPCAGDNKEFCGGAGTISLYQKCTGSNCKNIQYIVNNSTSSTGSGGYSPPYSPPASSLTPVASSKPIASTKPAASVKPTTSPKPSSSSPPAATYKPTTTSKHVTTAAAVAVTPSPSAGHENGECTVHTVTTTIALKTITVTAPVEKDTTITRRSTLTVKTTSTLYLNPSPSGYGA